MLNLLILALCASTSARSVSGLDNVRGGLAPRAVAHLSHSSTHHSHSGQAGQPGTTHGKSGAAPPAHAAKQPAEVGPSAPFKVTVGPKPAFRPIPASSARTRVCVVPGGTADDSAAILAAVTSCNIGGRVVFTKGVKYTIAKALDLTKLQHIDFDIQGSILFTPDQAYWTTHAFAHTFQNAVSFFQLGGVDVNVYGGGSLDGNGAGWGLAAIRPILFAVNGLKGGQIANLNLINSPQWFNLIRDSQDVVYSNIKIDGKNHNTDGWDILRSTNIVIQDSIINNGDDCVSFKPGSVDIVVQNLACNGSHGISVGSLGQYPGHVDLVENVIAYNISLTSSSNGARIKSWAGKGFMNGVGAGGGGSGKVNNISFEKFTVKDVDNAITVTQCYGQKDPALCAADPSKVSISNISITDFSGSMKVPGAPVGSVQCSTSTSCSNIVLKNIAIGTGKMTCQNYNVAGC